MVNDIDKIDFKRYASFKINDIRDIEIFSEKYKIKSIFADNYYDTFKKKSLKRISLNVLELEDLFKQFEVDIKQNFVDKF